VMNDVFLAPAMMSRNKLHLLPKRIKGAGQVGRIIDRCMKESRG
jgi:hypothetical protein